MLNFKLKHTFWRHDISYMVLNVPPNTNRSINQSLVHMI